MIFSSITAVANLINTGLKKFAKTVDEKIRNAIWNTKQKAKKYLKRRSRDS